MRRIDSIRCPRPAIAALALVAVLALAWRPPAARAGFRPDVVRLAGVLGGRETRVSLIDTFLCVGKKSLPFAVTAASHITPRPEGGVGVVVAYGAGGAAHPLSDASAPPE